MVYPRKAEAKVETTLNRKRKVGSGSRSIV